MNCIGLDFLINFKNMFVKKKIVLIIFIIWIFKDNTLPQKTVKQYLNKMHIFCIGFVIDKMFKLKPDYRFEIGLNTFYKI